MIKLITLPLGIAVMMLGFGIRSTAEYYSLENLVGIGIVILGVLIIGLGLKHFKEFWYEEE